MIPFASQRGEGAELGTHVQNELDNLEVERVEVRGTVARDADGWMREIEAQAHNLTRCTNYLYSLSINPDERRQGRWTREMYFDYIERTEQRFGLTGQPRLIYRHVKKDEHGIPREHYHAIWSRIDVEHRRAIHMAYDQDTLMMVTREFARDHGLRLPEGYDKHKVIARQRRGYQMTWHDKWQQDRGGLSLEKRKEQITEAWERRDNARSFVRSLEAMGYTLATGRRDYVLVDMYGFQKSLPRLIDDKKVRIEHVREFLGKDYPKDSLPGVDEALALAAAHRAAQELFRKEEDRAAREAKEKQRREELRRQQQPRRQAVESEATSLDDRQRHSRQEFSARQKQERMAFRQGYLQESRRIKLDRAANRPHGLAAFIGRITGVELITKKIHQYRDATRYRLFLDQKKELADRQKRDAATLQRRQELERAKLQWRLRALDQLEKREVRSLETKLLKDRRIEDRERTGRAPPPPEPTPDETPEKPIDLMAEFEKASAEPAPTRVDEFNRAAKESIDLTAEFERVSGSGDGEGDASGDAAQDPAPEAEIKVQRRRRTRDRTPDHERSTRTRRSDRDSDSPPSDDPGPTRGRRRDRDLDRGR
ncbi:MAG TPA: hypothetical protein VEU95_06850 [Micropepsaceae bacterium]|nr:hypothetical protein [Micropepsaceae bacterium]